MLRIRTVFSESGDWVVLYINGKPVKAAHSIHIIDLLHILDAHNVIEYLGSLEKDDDWFNDPDGEHKYLYE